MVDAMLFIGRTGCQWRYLPERYGAWTAVWAQWRRWRANGVWAAGMARLAAIVRVLHNREPVPSMVMVDAQTVKGGRSGPTFHAAGGRGGRTIGTKRTLLVEILGLPVAAAACSARPHDVVTGRDPLGDRIDELPRLRAIVGDRAYRGLQSLASRRHVALDIKAPPPGVGGFVPIRPFYRIEHAFAQLGRWRRLSRLLRGHRSVRPGLARSGLGQLPRLARGRLSRSAPPFAPSSSRAPDPRTPCASRVGLALEPPAHILIAGQYARANTAVS